MNWVFMACSGEPPERFRAHTLCRWFDWSKDITNRGKWKNIAALLAKGDCGGPFPPDSLFWFPDPDFEFEPGLPQRLFDAARDCKLDLCQPAYTRESLCSHQFLKQQSDPKPRQVPFVEIGCPVFSFAALQRNFWTFDLNYSGFGIELIWAKHETPYVLDWLTVHHPGPANYIETAQRLGFPNPQREMDEIKRLYL